MEQKERRGYLIRYLLNEREEYRDMSIPEDSDEQKSLLRSLMNVRPPQKISDSFLMVQDDYLKKETEEKGITDYHDLVPLQKGLYLWQGDITALRCDGIVNAANSGMTGCYVPCHGCIDNCIHTYAGVQLIYRCDEIMRAQGHYEETGTAKITSGYNLPARYVIHTVGPIVRGVLTVRNELQLQSCYRSCLQIAEQNGLKSIAFCCISTGEFHFPNQRAAEIAVKTVKEYLNETDSQLEVIFNVFKDTDYEIYHRLLTEH